MASPLSTDRSDGTRPEAERTIGIGHAHAQDETASEKVGRFFRRAVERLGGNEAQWPREEPGRPSSARASSWTPIAPSLRMPVHGGEGQRRYDPQRRPGALGSAADVEWRESDGGERTWQREPLAARDVMTRNPRAVERGGTLRDAAVIMREENCGVVPVVDGSGRLHGILTDRDIVVRGVTDDPRTSKVEDVMTEEVSAVTEDEPLHSVLDLMGRRQIRRVPVVDRSDRLVGIISLADIAMRADHDEDLQDAFLRISSRRSFWRRFT